MRAFILTAVLVWSLFSGGFFPASAVLGDFPATLTLRRVISLKDRLEMSQLRAHDRARHGRRLQSLDGVTDFQLYGSYNPFRVGLYYTNVQLGTPAQEFSVQIDTGSDALWVGCSGCEGCPTTTGLQNVYLNSFNPSSSSSSSVVSCSDKRCNMGAQSGESLCDNSNNCAYQLQYGDGSATNGYYVSDVFHLDTIVGNSRTSNNSAKILFGCSVSETALNNTDRAVAGIFGLGQQPMSVVTQLSSQGVTPAAFSHCLRGDDHGGGILVFGSAMEPGMVYSPLVPAQSHYNLNLESISVNGKKLSIDSSVFTTSTNSGTIIDSGTTLAYLADGAYDPFINAVTAAVSQSVRPSVSKGNTCYLLTSSVNDVFPEVSLNFAGGASMVLKPQDYLLEQTSIAGASVWCMGIQKNNGQSLTILGDLVLKDKIVVYDLANQQIGWVNYDCSQAINVSTSTGSNSKTYINTAQMSNSSSRRSIPYMTTLIGLIAMLVCLILF